MKKTKILAFVLTVVMIFSALSVCASAAYTPKALADTKSYVVGLGDNAQYITNGDFTAATYDDDNTAGKVQFSQQVTTYPNMYHSTDSVTGEKSLLLNKYAGTVKKFVDGTTSNYNTGSNVIASPDEGNNGLSLRPNNNIDLTQNDVVISVTMRFENFDNSFEVISCTFLEVNPSNTTENKNKQRGGIIADGNGYLVWKSSDEKLMKLDTEKAHTYTLVVKTVPDESDYKAVCDVYVDGIKIGADLDYTVGKDKDGKFPLYVYSFVTKMNGSFSGVECDCEANELTEITDAPAGYTASNIGSNKFYTCEHDKQLGYVQSASMYTLKKTYTAGDSFTHEFLYNSGNTVEGYDLTINNGVLGLNYYLNLTGDVLADDNAKVVFTTPRGEVQETLVKDVMAEANGSYRFTATVSSVEMAENITMQIKSGETVYKIYKDGAGAESYGYSVKDYAEKLLDDATYGDIAKAMLNYGAYAQLYFAAKSGNQAGTLANASCAYTTELDAVTIDVADPTQTGTGKKVAKLVLDTTTSIVIYDAEGNKIGEQTGISSKNLDTAYEIDCGTAGKVTVSVLAIGEKVLASQSVRDEYKSLIKALKLFSDASEALA